jgi:hypothetical protein
MYSETANESVPPFIDPPAPVREIQDMHLPSHLLDNAQIAERFPHSLVQFAILAASHQQSIQSLQYGQVPRQRDVELLGMGGFVSWIEGVNYYAPNVEIDDFQEYPPVLVVDDEMKCPGYEDHEVMMQTTP